METSPSFDPKSSFIVIGQEDTASLKKSILLTQADLLSGKKGIDKEQEDEYFSILKDAKMDAINKIKSRKKTLIERSSNVQIASIRQLVTSVNSKLVLASNITNVEEQKQSIFAYKTECNGFESLKTLILKNVENIYNKYLTSLNKLTLNPITGKRTADDTKKYLDDVMAALETAEKETASYFKEIEEESVKQENLVNMTTKKERELSNIDRCLTEVILPELARRQQWELMSEAFIGGYEQLTTKEQQTKKLFIDCLKPRDQEIVLPPVFINLLIQRPADQTPAVSEDWNSIKQAGLTLPERMLKVYEHIPNSCYNMKECDRLTQELKIVNDNIATELELQQQLQLSTAQIAQEISKDLEKARESSENLNLEQAEVSELSAELSRLIGLKQQQDLLIKQKKDVVSSLEHERDTIKFNNEKEHIETDRELSRALEDYSYTQKARYNKKIELQELQIEFDALETQKVRYDAIYVSNQNKLKEAEHLEIELNLVKNKTDLLKTDIEELKRGTK